MTVKTKIRPYVDAPLGKGQSLSLPHDRAHYLTEVMRQKAGALIALFNCCDRDWQAELETAEQCGETCAPPVAALSPWRNALGDWR